MCSDVAKQLVVVVVVMVMVMVRVIPLGGPYRDWVKRQKLNASVVAVPMRTSFHTYVDDYKSDRFGLILGLISDVGWQESRKEERSFYSPFNLAQNYSMPFEQKASYQLTLGHYLFETSNLRYLNR